VIALPTHIDPRLASSLPRTAVLLAAAVCAVACGSHLPRVSEGGDAEGGLSVVRMRHQISFAQGDDVQVFDGYMLLAGERLLVKAFAGPGVDLFTVVRDGAAHGERLHIKGLADRIDMAKVGADIARVYLGGCAKPAAGASEATCTFYGEPMIESFDAGVRLTARRFPQAHGIGLTVTYAELAEFDCGERARRITLRWGGSGNEMVIRLVACERLERVDPKVFAIEEP
jgi:hypothetical protein